MFLFRVPFAPANAGAERQATSFALLMNSIAYFFNLNLFSLCSN
nr:MAG TPA: hypothetical protein [Inoviridae sp.]